MTRMVSADTDLLERFVTNGERHVGALQGIYNDVASRRAMVVAELNHEAGVSADRSFAELMVEAESTTLFVEVIHDALLDVASVGPVTVVPQLLLDLAFARSRFDPTGADLTLHLDIEALDSALAEALSDGDISEVRRLRELRAIALKANGALARAEQIAFDELIADDVPPYAAWLLSTMTPAEVTEQIRADVYAEAGVSADRWVPSLGVPDNVDTINAVYEYYPKLYAIDPNMQWVGLASIAAPQFYAGFLDISDLRVVAATGGDLAEVLRSTTLPSPLAAQLGEMTADELAEALWFMETTFLEMQKQIFDDMAVQHYAYQVGGIDLVEAFAHGTVDTQNPIADQVAETLYPWRLFDDRKFDESTGLLVDREQRDIIQDEYRAIWDHSLATKLFVTAAGFTAVDPSGGPSFLDHVLTPDLIAAGIEIPDFSGNTPDIPRTETPPLVIGGPGGQRIVWDPPDIPGLPIPDLPSFTTPDISIDIDWVDPSANVANEEDRMKWIVEVINAYVLDRWHNDPDGLAAQTRLDLLTEVETYRQIPTWARP